jgi:hypothetical protein
MFCWVPHPSPLRVRVFLFSVNSVLFLCGLCVKYLLFRLFSTHQILTRSAGVKYNFSPSFT